MVFCGCLYEGLILPKTKGRTRWSRKSGSSSACSKTESIAQQHLHPYDDHCFRDHSASGRHDILMVPPKASPFISSLASRLMPASEAGIRRGAYWMR